MVDFILKKFNVYNIERKLVQNELVSNTGNMFKVEDFKSINLWGILDIDSTKLEDLKMESQDPLTIVNLGTKEGPKITYINSQLMNFKIQWVNYYINIKIVLLEIIM